MRPQGLERLRVKDAPLFRQLRAPDLSWLPRIARSKKFLADRLLHGGDMLRDALAGQSKTMGRSCAASFLHHRQEGTQESHVHGRHDQEP